MFQYLIPLISGTRLLHDFMTKEAFNINAAIIKPPYFTSIIMCSLNEEGFIERALESIDEQTVVKAHPELFEKILMDSNSSDNTVLIAQKHGWTVYQVPRGKLTARHLGMQAAKGEIIVSIDCDMYYPPNWINLLMKWFYRKDVVAVVTPRLVDPIENQVLTALSVWMSMVDVGPLLAGGMRAPGGNMAMLKQAYYDVGGFNLNINQQNMHAMVREEEVHLPMKLRAIGRVPVEWRAASFTSMRRITGVGKGKKYRNWHQERLKGERF